MTDLPWEQPVPAQGALTDISHVRGSGSIKLKAMQGQRAAGKEESTGSVTKASLQSAAQTATGMR